MKMESPKGKNLFVWLLLDDFLEVFFAEVDADGSDLIFNQQWLVVSKSLGRIATKQCPDEEKEQYVTERLQGK